MIPKVVASEIGRAQTISRNTIGVKDYQNDYGGYKNCLGKQTEEGESPVRRNRDSEVGSGVVRDTRNLV